MLSSVLLTTTILTLSIPLAFLAVITSGVAFLALFVRVMLVYIDLAAVLIRSYLFVRAPPKPRHRRRKSSGNLHATQQQQQQRRRRHRSISQTSSLEQSVSKGDGGEGDPPTTTTASGHLERPGSVRDFEGVGGWRFPGSEEDETQWTLLNSRLELPAASERKRRHRRSLTSSSVPFPPGAPARREKKHGSETSTLNTPGTASIPPVTPPAADAGAHDFPSSRSVPDLGLHPTTAYREGSPSRERTSPYSTPSSSRTSSRGSQLLMKHSVRD